MRRPRFPTPLSAPPLDPTSLGSETGLRKTHATSVTEWQEPPLRAPAPSFEDYKGLERQGVLEYFQPLGTMPSQRVKLRIKAFDNPKRPAQPKDGERTVAGSEDTTTPDPAPPPPSRRSESRKTEDRTSRIPAARVKDEDSEYTPSALAAVTPSKPVSPYFSHHGTPSSHLPATKNARLKDVVANAIARAHSQNDPVLGHALSRLYEQSLQDSSLVDLIDGILSENPNEQQKASFQRYLKRLTKDISRKTGMPLVKVSPQARGTPMDLNSMAPQHNGRSSVSGSRTTGMDRGSKDHNNSKPTSHPYSPTKPSQHSNKLLSNNTSPVHRQSAPDRARRSNSTSSLSSVASSLSSVDPNLALEGEEEFGGNSAPLLPPIDLSGAGKSKGSVGPKMGTFITTSSHKRPYAAIGLSKEDEELASKRRKLRKTFPDYAVKNSDVRTAVQNPVGLTSKKLLPPRVQHPRQEAPRLINGMEGEGSDELDSPSTSIHSDLLIPPPPFAGTSHRGATPTNLGRPSKPTKKSARVKMSPLKKKNGVVAGMPRSSGVRNSPIGSLHADGEGLNSDDCSACGGPGELLCCDGCTRAYHFTCIDPPKDSLPDGEWYCQACASQPGPPPAPTRGVFPILLHSLATKTPTAYNLPRSLRNYYEGVITGEDGEYEEPGAPPSKAKSRTGYDVPMDTFKLKDSKDNIILCYKCHESAMGRREMVNCDFCSLYWHLDCVNPPLASAPKKFGKSTWKCPNHVDSEIAVPRSASGKIYKIRRPKDPRVIVPALTRGIKNNGMIEIEDEISEEEDQPPGTIFLIPARTVKLDFISKFKQNKEHPEAVRMGKHEATALKADSWRQQHPTDSKAQRDTYSTADSPSTDELFQGRSSAERDVAWSLAQFAQSDSNLQISGDRVEELVSTLYAEAPAGLFNGANGNNYNTSGAANGVKADSKMNVGVITSDATSSQTKKATTSNEAAYAANQANAVGSSCPSTPETHLPEEELAEILKLEAIVQRKKANIQKRIAAMRTTAVASV
ncbi:MAG: hypothetical protein Q9200_002378 [Gallowayella weberi]